MATGPPPSAKAVARVVVRARPAGNENTAIIEAALREPEKILAHQAAGRLIEFGQRVGLLLLAVLHFIADAEDPWRIVATLRDALAPGSYLVLGQGTAWRAARNFNFGAHDILPVTSAATTSNSHAPSLGA
jgi:hypothetical protein